MLEQLQNWWQNVTPETVALAQEGAVAFVLVVAGWFFGSMVGRVLRSRNFDATLRLPGSAYADPDRSITPTWVAGIFVRLTVWTAVGWWLANRHGQTDLAHTLGLVLSRAWSLAAVLVAALALGSLLAHRLSECLQGLTKSDADPVSFRNGNGNGIASHRSGAPGLPGAVSAIVYVVSVLLVLLMAADLFDWPLTRSSALALWQFAQHMLVAGAALFIGSLGARWARDQVSHDTSESPEKRAGQYTSLVIIAATTVLAVAVLLSSAGVLLGVAAIVLLGLVVYLGRNYLPDIAAGLQLRAYKVREVFFEGDEWQVSEIGFLTTQVCRAGQFYTVPNHQVLEARMRNAPEEAAAR